MMRNHSSEKWVFHSVNHQIYKNAISSLNSDDRNLPQVKSILPLIKRGVGVHHGGLLPIIKETIEILFQEGLLKVCLFRDYYVDPFCY